MGQITKAVKPLLLVGIKFDDYPNPVGFSESELEVILINPQASRAMLRLGPAPAALGTGKTTKTMELDEVIAELEASIAKFDYIPLRVATEAVVLLKAYKERLEDK